LLKKWTQKIFEKIFLKKIKNKINNLILENMKQFFNKKYLERLKNIIKFYLFIDVIIIFFSENIWLILLYILSFFCQYSWIFLLILIILHPILPPKIDKSLLKILFWFYIISCINLVIMFYIIFIIWGVTS